MYEHVPTFVCAYVYMHGALGALCSGCSAEKELRFAEVLPYWGEVLMAPDGDLTVVLEGKG